MGARLGWQKRHRLLRVRRRVADARGLEQRQRQVLVIVTIARACRHRASECLGRLTSPAGRKEHTPKGAPSRMVGRLGVEPGAEVRNRLGCAITAHQRVRDEAVRQWHDRYVRLVPNERPQRFYSLVEAASRSEFEPEIVARRSVTRRRDAQLGDRLIATSDERKLDVYGRVHP